MASFLTSGKKVGSNFNILISYLTYYYQIIAIGRNFAEHAKELNNAVPKEPFFFLKPTTSYLHDGGKIEIPRGVKAHHESAVVVGLRGHHP